jgi:hypothetical protein
VARSEYGGQLVRNRRACYTSLFPRLRGQHLDYSLLQSPWYLAGRVLLDIWALVWSTADGTFEVLFRFLRRQDQCVPDFTSLLLTVLTYIFSCCVQHSGVHWLVFCEHHRWCPADTRGEQ